MADLIILMEDKRAMVSPLCENQLDPTKLNLVHPSKHVPPEDENFTARPFSLFMNLDQRNILVKLIATNPIVKKIILNKIESMGGNFRVFADIRVADLIKGSPDTYLQMHYWSYCEYQKTHVLKPLVWVSICLDFVAEQQSKDRMVASMQTIFPLESEHKLFKETNDQTVCGIYDQARLNHEHTMIFMELQSEFHSERRSFSADGQELARYELNSSSVSLVRPWDVGLVTHNIFLHSKSILNKKAVREQVVTSLKPLPYPDVTAPNLEKKKESLVADFRGLKLECTQGELCDYLEELGFESSVLDSIVEHIFRLDIIPYDCQTDFDPILISLKREIEATISMSRDINLLGIEQLAKNHFPRVDRKDLVEIYSEIIHRLDYEEHLLHIALEYEPSIKNKREPFSPNILVQYKDHLFQVESNNLSALNKNKLTFCSILNELIAPEIPDAKIIGKAVGILRLSMLVQGQVICKHPDLIAILELIGKKRTLLETTHRKVLAFQKSLEDSVKIERIIEENKAIQLRAIERPLIEINEQLQIISTSSKINIGMVTLLQKHLEDNADNYAVTKALDIQIKIFAKSLKEKFLQKLMKLINQIVKDNNDPDHALFINNLGLQNKELFFSENSGTFKCNPSLFSLPKDEQQEKFYEVIGEARDLIKVVNKYFIGAGPEKEKYDVPIRELANAIQEFYDFRQCNPYAFTPIVDGSCSLVQAKVYLEMIVDGLRNRLIYERKYSIALQMGNSEEAHRTKVSILCDFLNATDRQFIPLDSTKKALEVIGAALTSAKQKSKSHSTSPLLLLGIHSPKNEEEELSVDSNNESLPAHNCFPN